MEGKVAVLGDSDFVLPFSALGVETFAVSQDHDEIAAAAGRIVDEGCSLVIVAENVARDTEEAFAATQSQPTPCVVVIPFTTESEGFASEALGKVLKLATGINIMDN